MKKLKAFVLVAVLVPGLFALSLLPGKVLAVTVSDDFNRPNGALGANWTTMAGTAAPQILNNQVVPSTTAAVNAAYWSANVFASNQYAQANLPSVPGAQFGPAVAVRMAAAHGYFLWYGDAGNEVSIWRMDSAGSRTKIKQSGVLAMNGTDTWRLEAVGSTLSGYQNGNLVVQVNDATYTRGSPGMWLYNAGDQLDNWSGGDLAGTYTVGGEASGVAGTVVLTDNGGDDLSVGSTGAFAFATPLSSGADYNVAVKTNPVGQTCTVSDGSGAVGATAVTNVAVNCESTANTVASDNFNRPNGPLGAGWTDMSDGGMAISSGAAVGTVTGLNSGDIRTGETYSQDQFSQMEVSSTQLTGGQWMGVTVRSQNSGQNLYLGIYWWNNGSPELLMYMRNGASYSQIGNSYNCGPLAAGTQLKLMVVGNTLAFMENGVERIAGTDSTLTGGAPGIMDFDTPTDDNWTGGNAGFEVHYLSTDANGVESYDMISRDNSAGPQVLRVLRPTSPAPGMPHNILMALPVEAGLGTSFGDGIDTLRTLNAQNQYNLTIVEPSFADESWYANDPLAPYKQDEAFMVSELTPWVKQNLGTTGYEQNWLIGFSKSGIGGMDLLLKHPDLFAVGASWDWPADDAAYDQFGGSSQNGYGTDANFQANYRLTQAFLDNHKAPFVSNSRIWIGSYNAFQTDVSDFDTLLTAGGIPHLTETPALIAHRWDSGWVPDALAALHANSLGLPDTTAPTVASFTVQASSNSLTVPVTALTATDDIGVTGYKITESAIAPLAGDAGWSGSAPVSYTFGGTGSKTLYAWAKDAAGNVSVAMSAPVTVTPIYTIGGSVSGLAGTVVLLNASTSEVLSVGANGAFAFAGTEAGGEGFNVAVSTQPSGQTCSVSGGAGTVVSSNVMSIAVTCATNPAPPVVSGGGTVTSVSHESAKSLAASAPTPTPAPAATPAATPLPSPATTPECSGSDCAEAASGGSADSNTSGSPSTDIFGLSRLVVYPGVGVLILIGFGFGFVLIRRARRPNNLV